MLRNLPSNSKIQLRPVGKKSEFQHRQCCASRSPEKLRPSWPSAPVTNNLFYGIIINAVYWKRIAQMGEPLFGAYPCQTGLISCSRYPPINT